MTGWLWLGRASSCTVGSSEMPLSQAVWLPRPVTLRLSRPGAPAACPLDEGFPPSLLTLDMNMLVLGGTGFIGSHLAERLAASNHRVRVVDHCPNVWGHSVPGVDYRFFELND